MSSRVFFTSDTHFGHNKILLGESKWEDKSNCRDFSTMDEHDAYILDNINRLVRPCDTLYHLGDFGWGFREKSKVKEYRERILCERVILILGNHDHVLEDDDAPIRKLFTRVKHLHYGSILGKKMVLCHYAMRSWPWQRYGSIHLYGHSHGRLAGFGRSMDVGVDTYSATHPKYTPYSAEEVFAIMCEWGAWWEKVRNLSTKIDDCEDLYRKNWLNGDTPEQALCYNW